MSKLISGMILLFRAIIQNKELWNTIFDAVVEQDKNTWKLGETKLKDARSAILSNQELFKETIPNWLINLGIELAIASIRSKMSK